MFNYMWYINILCVPSKLYDNIQIIIKDKKTEMENHIGILVSYHDEIDKKNKTLQNDMECIYKLNEQTFKENPKEKIKEEILNQCKIAGNEIGRYEEKHKQIDAMIQKLKINKEEWFVSNISQQQHENFTKEFERENKETFEMRKKYYKDLLENLKSFLKNKGKDIYRKSGLVGFGGDDIFRAIDDMDVFDTINKNLQPPQFPGESGKEDKTYKKMVMILCISAVLFKMLLLIGGITYIILQQKQNNQPFNPPEPDNGY
ncbi:hypothetical protein EHP00_1325 [Ecytonucleospora hepatopenaei]|uniref:Uncharacterized protein n=1 Tax=Ecytonucleospora hepatopenaei TaxID=646526 RepID=A0A1W0E5E1_9MICR|nr:hypothetical protein EHP00_1325 [Ecytonucleospora hepatopenaei]